jgi:DME family drug/metabolite transporter
VAVTLGLAEPVVAAILGLVVLGERLTPVALLGLVLVGLALAILVVPPSPNLLKLRRVRSSRPSG